MTYSTKISTRAIKLIETLGGTAENLMPLARFSSAEALRYPRLGRKTLAEVRAVLLDIDLDFNNENRCPGHIGSIKPIDGYSEKVDAFIAAHYIPSTGRSASHTNSKTMQKLIKTRQFYADGLAKTEAALARLGAHNR